MIKKIALIAAALALVMLCGTVAAYMIKTTVPRENILTPASVDCEVAEAFDGSNKTSIRVTNTGTVDAYLRVRLVTYWVDESGNIQPKASAKLTVSLADNWFEKEENTYYYRFPVTPGALTGEMLGAAITLQEKDGYFQVVEVFAEAIQSEPARAVETSWGVTVDGDGKLTLSD